MTKKRILIVGAGCAGMSCADQFAEDGDKFDVTLIDSIDRCGGQAFSIDINEDKYGAKWLNQGVQGGSPIFHHTFRMFKRQNYEISPVKLQVSFGKDEYFWTNVFPTKLVEKHRWEIKKFLFLLKIIRKLEFLFLFVPIKILMKLFFFSNDFTNYMILPTVALFLGTGNATPDVSSVILERLFTSSTCGMWYKPDQESLISNLPSMFVFPNLTDFYTDWKKNLEQRGIHIRLSTELTEVIQRNKHGVRVKLKSHQINETSRIKTSMTNFNEEIEEFDEMILCILPDQAKKILGKTARWIDKFILGWAKFADDITVTHCDIDYMNKYYTNNYQSNEAIEDLHGRDERQRCDFGKTNFKPMYYIKQYKTNPNKLEMSFDCTNYQSQFSQTIPFSNHIFQTIFLNKNHSYLWTKNEINKEKIIREDWWHQLCHSWTHYLFVVPWMWLLNGVYSTTFAGSWTLVNAHEIASISGIAAAYSLGIDYPQDLENDHFALLCFRLFLLISHGKWYRKKKTHHKSN
ncbi:unnamed protein product [Adineta steineri]|uniref:Flavin-containing amine oxidasedehydrogenase-like protein n=2 Tax=Adineta steineri TaxID=433720 RepID=A0A818G835_9BILA|nr:unnamed protein product [Adineta steineri]CAF3487498.1 unnamed protein product [Adineta steineri]